jgi:hypothetical protein
MATVAYFSEKSAFAYKSRRYHDSENNNRKAIEDPHQLLRQFSATWMSGNACRKQCNICLRQKVTKAMARYEVVKDLLGKYFPMLFKSL